MSSVVPDRVTGSYDEIIVVIINPLPQEKEGNSQGPPINTIIFSTRKRIKGFAAAAGAEDATGPSNCRSAGFESAQWAEDALIRLHFAETSSELTSLSQIAAVVPSLLPGRHYYICDDSNRFSAGIKFSVNRPKLTAIYDIWLQASPQKHSFHI